MTHVQTNLATLGEVVWLMAHSDLHRNWPIESIFQWVVPALMHKQCRLYRSEGKPVGYVAWAYLSTEVEEAYVLNTRSLQPKDWTSGDRLWIIDLIAPFGEGRNILTDLRHGLFKDEIARVLRAKTNSNEMRIKYVHGAGAHQKKRDPVLNAPVDLRGAAKRVSLGTD